MQRKTSIRTDGDRKGLFGGGTDDRRRQMRTNLRSITFVRKHTYKVKDDHSPPRLKERLTSCGTNMIQQAKDTLAGSLFLWVNPVSRTCGNATSRTHTHTRSLGFSPSLRPVLRNLGLECSFSANQPSGADQHSDT